MSPSGGRKSRAGSVRADHLSFIARIYDAALEPGAWPSLLDELSSHTSARAANILVVDLRHPEVQVTGASAVLDPDLLARYLAEYAEEEARTLHKVMAFPERQWIRDTDVWSGPIEEFPTAAWLRRERGIFRRSCARLNANKGWFDLVTLNMASDRGPLSATEIGVADLFLPHLAKAVEIARPFQILRTRFHQVLQALDRFHLGVFVLGPGGHVVLTNREARRILDLEDGLRLDPAGRLRPRNDDVATSLGRAIDLALATARAEGSTAETLVTMPRPSGRDPFLAEVSPLGRGDLAVDGRASGALVFMIDPDHRAVVSTRGMQELFELTEAEADVLRLLVDGHDSPDMADLRGVSVHTVKSQIKSVLAKTGTRGRPALVRLALSVNPPVDPAPHQGS